MSYDVSLVINTGKEDKEIVEVGNITWNLLPMFRLAMATNFKDLNGKKCKDVIPILKRAVEEMKDAPDIYKALEPPNKWGTYEEGLNFLKNFLCECEENPECKISIF